MRDEAKFVESKGFGREEGADHEPPEGKGITVGRHIGWTQRSGLINGQLSEVGGTITGDAERERASTSVLRSGTEKSQLVFACDNNIEHQVD